LNTTAVISPKPRSNKVPSRDASSVRVSDRTISGLSEIFKLLADKSRLKILLALSQNGELNVSALCDLLDQTQPAVSHHLTLLRMTGLVGFRRDGKHNFYRIESSAISQLLDDFFNDGGHGPMQLQFEEFSLTYKKK